jgi:hypothetical protein
MRGALIAIIEFTTSKGEVTVFHHSMVVEACKHGELK